MHKAAMSVTLGLNRRREVRSRLVFSWVYRHDATHAEYEGL